MPRRDPTIARDLGLAAADIVGIACDRSAPAARPAGPASTPARPGRRARGTDPGVEGPARAPTEGGGGHAALAELRAALAEVDAEQARAHAERDHAERPVPLDQQVESMAGAAPLGRLRRGPVERRRNPPGSQVAADPFIPLALADFHDLRRLGLFGDDGRNPPPSWWTR